MHREIFHLGYSVNMAAESDTAELMLYGEIITNMPECFKWSREDKSAADFKRAIDGIRKEGAKNLLLRINSPGGVCTEAVAMRSIIVNAGFDNIKIRIEGLCASAATDLATIPGAHVSISEGSEYMIHNPWTFAIGDSHEMDNAAERLRNIEQMSREFYAKRTGQSEDQIRKWMDAETWFTAKQAVEYGFADEIIEAETPIAACATSHEMAVMRALYKALPEQIKEVSDGTPVAGVPTEINQCKEENPMELENITLDQLRNGNPALFNQVQQEAITAERERLSDIDALTDPGYEEMAAQAKANGTSAMEFHKQIAAARRQKGAEFLQARQQEMAPAQEISGGDPGNNDRNSEQEIQDNAKAIAEYAKMCTSGYDSMF